ncbi:MAG: NADH:flavin oxidoreductase [Candidatus Hodarchaeota archaeon]
MFKITLEMLFSPKKIGSVQIKNRIVRSATFEGMASKEGYVTEQLIYFYKILAQGGTGLIITSASAADSRYTVGSRCMCFNDDEFISGQKKLVQAVHEYSGAKIGAQIAHNGRQGTHPKYRPVAPSPVLYKPTNKIPKELTGGEIEEIIKKFALAGRRAYESGYDMVQLHGAHGYLLSNFLSPYTNKRTDDFGGNTQKRTKILVDIYHQMRDEVGKNFPIIIKLQVLDGVEEGITLEEAKKITQILVDTGYDAIEPSGGLSELQMKSDNELPSKKVKSQEDENYLSPAIKTLHPIMKKCALIQVGGIRNPLSAEEILKANNCEFISLSRPLIREPNLPNRWRKGDFTPPSCISCNSCLIAIFTGQPLHCVVEKRLERKKRKKNLKKL